MLKSMKTYQEKKIDRQRPQKLESLYGTKDPSYQSTLLNTLDSPFLVKRKA